MGAPAAFENVLSSANYRLAGEYAHALLDSLDADVSAQAVATELEELVGLLRATDGAEELLAAACLSRDRAVALTERLFAGRLSKPVEAVLAVLARNGRLTLLAGVARRCRQILHQREGKTEVAVTSAVAIDETAQAELTAELERMLSAPVAAAYRVDPEILGGLCVQVADRLFDASVASSLEGLRRRILTGASLSMPPGAQEKP